MIFSVLVSEFLFFSQVTVTVNLQKIGVKTC